MIPTGSVIEYRLVFTACFHLRGSQALKLASVPPLMDGVLCMVFGVCDSLQFPPTAHPCRLPTSPPPPCPAPVIVPAVQQTPLQLRIPRDFSGPPAFPRLLSSRPPPSRALPAALHALRPSAFSSSRSERSNIAGFQSLRLYVNMYF